MTRLVAFRAPWTATALAAALALAACKQAPVTMTATPDKPAPSLAAPAPVAGIERRFMDPAVRPQDDMFRSANGAWLDHTEIPPDRSIAGGFAQLIDETQDQQRALIESIGRGGETADPDARKIADLYGSFMDEPALEALGAKPLRAELAAIDAVREPRQLAALFARLGRLGVAMPIAFSVGVDDRDSSRYLPQLAQGPLGLPDRDYYLKLDDAKFQAVRAKYVDYQVRLLTLAGVSSAKAAQTQARAVLALETALAKAQWTRVQNRDPVKTYNLVPVAGLSKLSAAIDWKAFLGEAGFAGKSPQLLVAQPSYLSGLGTQIGATPLATWKSYAKVRLLSAYAPYLSQPFVDAQFAFAGTTLQGTPQNRPRWRRGATLVNDSIGEGLGRLYVARHFPAENKARMEQLVANLLAAYKTSIDGLDWMSPETKQQAQAKLATFLPKIGYPKRWIDYGTLQIKRDDLVGNVMRARQFQHARAIAKLGGPVDRDAWEITPQTVNAYYNPSFNEIVFPAAILQPPFFNARADDAVNYGAIGAVIGHEISHGFDDQGSQYDAQGNLRDWWTAADRARFAEKTRMLVAQYNQFEPVPGYKVNGELTLGENIADNSGLEIAYKAYRLSLQGKPAPVIDGLSGDERFFYGFAQVWRTKMRDDAAIERVKTDPHSPGQFRANGTLRNHSGFYSTFGLKPGDGMYLAPAERVSIW